MVRVENQRFRRAVELWPAIWGRLGITGSRGFRKADKPRSSCACTSLADVKKHGEGEQHEACENHVEFCHPSPHKALRFDVEHCAGVKSPARALYTLSL